MSNEQLKEYQHSAIKAAADLTQALEAGSGADLDQQRIRAGLAVQIVILCEIARRLPPPLDE